MITLHPYAPDADSVLPLAERRVFFNLLSAVLDEMPDCRPKWVACLAFGAHPCIGRSLEDMGGLAGGVAPATLMKDAQRFCATHNLAPSPFMVTFASKTKAPPTAKGGQA